MILVRTQIAHKSRMTGQWKRWERYGYYPTTADALAAHLRPGRRVSVCAVRNLPSHIDPQLSRRAIVHSLEAPAEWAVIKDLAGGAFAIAALAIAVFLVVPQVAELGEVLAAAVLTK